MVAITVILAAVIAAFVFGMAGSISKTKVVSATLSRVNSTAVTSTFQGGQDAGSLMSINWTVDGADAAQQIVGTSPLPIGNSLTFTAGTGTHVIGIATFSDNSQQVIVDTKI